MQKNAYVDQEHTRDESQLGKARAASGVLPNRLLTAGTLEHYPAFKREVLETGVVSGMTRSLNPATEVYSHNVINNWPGRQPNDALNLVMNALGDSD